MEDTSKYLIHAKITADGVVERSDVVGAIFGQTEGLLGDELDLRDLQQSSKVGRIDVDVESERGQSFGEITIASSLDKVETAILAASLETLTRVGPCEARVEVSSIEDVRAAKRRVVVERAKQLLSDAFEETVLSSDELQEEVRESVRAGELDDYRGLPAGPSVADGDAVIVVEGRADVLRLLKFGIKNAVAVEGTNVPDAVADLTRDRTVTAFFDGDRGGELILRELAQVGDVDYVAFAPEGESVEDLSRQAVFAALREKTPYEVYRQAREAGDADTGRSVAATDGSATPAPHEPSDYGSEDSSRTASTPASESPAAPGDDDRDADSETDAAGEEPGGDLVETVRESLADEPFVDDGRDASATEGEDGAAATPAPDDADATTPTEPRGPTPDESAPDDSEAEEPVEAEDEAGKASAADSAPSEQAESEAGDEASASSLGDHVREVVGGETGQARLLDEAFETVATVDADEAFDAVESAEGGYALVLDGELSQRVLDVAAQRGLDHVVAVETGEFVKQPVSPRVRTPEGFLD